jgi:mRNA-degrading endonuclease RelE of RelBE toxin-antitoxin system
MREIMAFPRERSPSLWEKINYLVSDPFPDGRMKKKLKGSDGIFRLRVGDYRVFYRFGDDWVSLLGLRRRREDTYTGVPDADGETGLPPEFEDDLDAALEAAKPRAFAFQKEEEANPLPVKITEEWLGELGVPVPAYPFLLRCRTEDDLLEAPIGGDVLALVIDAIFPPSLDQVEQQPDLVVPSTDHLVRYKEGDLLGFLLRLDEDQRQLASWALSGPTMLRGGAGTGKSTVAIYRVKEVMERAGATKHERVLFTTYTRALISVTKQLLGQILTEEQMLRVQVMTCDQVAHSIVAGSRRMGAFESSRDQMTRLQSLREEFMPSAKSAFEVKLRKRALDRLSNRYLLEEFEWIIEGRGLSDLDEYLAAPRPGRGVAFPARLRETVWELHSVYAEESQVERFSALRNEALGLVRDGTWDKHWT